MIKLIFPKYYRDGVFKSFSLYWKCYTAGNSLAKSPYLHFSIILTSLSWPIWINGEPNWYQSTLNIVPSILGFTLGGYAILLAFGNEKFMELISGDFPDGDISSFMKVNGVFVHFIFLQIITVVYSFFSSVWKAQTGIIAILGCCLFYYTILSAIGAAMSILNLANCFDIFCKFKQNQDEQKIDDKK